VRNLHVAILLLPAMLLAGCGGSGNDDADTATGAVTAQPTTAAAATTAAPTTAEDATTTETTSGESTAAAATGTIDIQYTTGPLPPVYNYEITLKVDVAADGTTADYKLTYPYADSVPADSTEQAGEDVQWSGVVDDATTEIARGLLAEPGLTPPADDGAVGGDTWDVSVTAAGTDAQTGVPDDADRYDDLICAVDAQARQAPGAAKQTNGPC
jgi:hypothetical protein